MSEIAIIYKQSSIRRAQVIMATEPLFEPRYTNSWALIVGINNYLRASPLDYACNDATKFAETLRKKFGFPDENVTLIVDEFATKERILSEYMAFATEKIAPNDRLIVFYAGHGYTQTGNRGEVGFLVPVDGTTNDLASLIRWDELTRNAELIPAKHILFIMDACYGGLALTRALPPGSMRFAKNMLQRYSRQVLTAGKANEVVADSGGPRQGHSIFTGHMLDALDGSGATTDGILTANGVMAYVYDRVAKDQHSSQTPHYGFLDGDGDMIFDLSPIEELIADSETDKDILITVPPSYLVQQDSISNSSLEDHVKECLSDNRYRIKLHDLVVAEIRRSLSVIGDDSFPVQSDDVSPEEFANRLRRYEDSMRDLITIVVLLARWGNEEHRGILEQIFARMPDSHIQTSGKVLWLGLRWYPVLLLMYSGGIAALAGNNYANLNTVLTTQVATARGEDEVQPVIVPTVEGILDVERTNIFKSLPGHERHYVPRSEYLFKVIQPLLEDTLLLGRDYERLYDQFEVFFALVDADQLYDKRGRVWGPPGRFAWKYRSGMRTTEPFSEIVNEAERQKGDWRPLKAGLFNGSHERFLTIANAYKEDLLRKLNWF